MGYLEINPDADTGELPTAERVDLWLLRKLSAARPDGRLPDGRDWLLRESRSHLFTTLRNLVDKKFLRHEPDQRPASPRKGAKAQDPLPEALAADEKFLAKWEEWEANRRQMGEPLTEIARKNQLDKCLKWGPEAAVRVIDHCINSGWRGLYPPKGFDPGRKAGESADAADKRQRAEKCKQAEEIAARQRIEEENERMMADLRGLAEADLECWRRMTIESAAPFLRAKLHKEDPLGGGTLTQLIWTKWKLEGDQ